MPCRLYCRRFDPRCSMAERPFDKETYALDPCRPAVFHLIDDMERARYARMAVRAGEGEQCAARRRGPNDPTVVTRVVVGWWLEGETAARIRRDDTMSTHRRCRAPPRCLGARRADAVCVLTTDTRPDAIDGDSRRRSSAAAPLFACRAAMLCTMRRSPTRILLIRLPTLSAVSRRRRRRFAAPPLPALLATGRAARCPPPCVCDRYFLVVKGGNLYAPRHLCRRSGCSLSTTAYTLDVCDSNFKWWSPRFLPAPHVLPS